MDGETEGTRTLLGDQRKGIVALAIPIGIALFFQQLNNIVDSLWVSALGGTALAALGVVYPVYTILIGIGNGLGIGVSAAIARSIGRGSREDANASAAQGVTIAAIVSIILTPFLMVTAESSMGIMGAGSMVQECLDYAYPIYISCFFIILSGVMSGMLRGEGAARKSMAIQVAGAVVNIILDPIFIYTLDMGVAGAAWATVIAFIVSCAMASYWYLRSRDLFVHITRRDYRPDRRTCKEIMSVGGPEALELSIMYLFNITLNYVVIGCGGTDAVGLYSTGWRIANFILIIAQAMGGALVAVCSAEYGMRRFDMIRDAFRFTVVSSIAWTLLFSVLLALGSGLVAGVFTSSDDLQYMHGAMQEMLLYFAIFLPIMSMVYTGSALLQAIKHAGGAMMNSLTRNILLNIGFFSMAAVFGTLTSLWWAMTVAEIVGGLMMGIHAWIMLRRVSAREESAPPASPQS
ncbi:MAG: MATE family efflux transporter [Thermoplasmata archaeon]|nr:MATE family efflux transporter [Thermoplasmata archaeon]